MKRLTLNETWKLCLAMWKWIAGQIKEGSTESVSSLKRRWLKEHGFSHNVIAADCFFCEYCVRRNLPCPACPGKLVSPRFDCSNVSYEYIDKPIAFYNKLVSLNRKRLKK